MSSNDMASLEFHHVCSLARLLGAPVMVFDLESTTFRGRPNFGITEVACFMATLEGVGVEFNALIDPERSIDARVAELTGITQSMVRGKQNWGVRYAGLFERMSREVWLTGFNVKTFDLPAVSDMNERYGVPIKSFERTFDVRDLHLKLSGSTSRKGKLVDVAAQYGVRPRGSLHRAAADTALTLETLNAIIEAHGLETVANYILPKPEGAFDQLTTNAIVRYVKSRKAVDVPTLAADFGKSVADTGFEVAKAIDERLVDADVFAHAPAQQWLAEALVELDIELLTAGRLRPMHDALQAACPQPQYLDFVQLRVALLRANLGWNSLKPL